MPDTTSNPIDWAGDYWDQNHLDGDEERFLVMISFLGYYRIVVEAIERELRPYELKLTDYLLLMTLELSGSGTRLISSLARNLMVHPTTATIATDRLESKRMLVRSQHPTDRRAICVTISDEGRRLVRDATVALDSVDFGFAGGTEANLATLGKVLKVLRTAANDPPV